MQPEGGYRISNRVRVRPGGDRGGLERRPAGLFIAKGAYMSRVGWVLWQAAVMGVLRTAWGTRCCAAEVQGRAIEPLEAAKTLDALYSGIAGYRWKYRLEFLKAGNPKALDIAGLRAAPDGPEFGAGSVAIDIRTMRYVAEYQSVRRWSGRAAKYLSEREEHRSMARPTGNGTDAVMEPLFPR